MAWWQWSIVAGVLAVLEMLVPGSYLIWIALGAAVTVAVELLAGLALHAQLGVFAAASAVSCAIGYRAYRHTERPRAEPALNERERAIIGARGVVCAPLETGESRVRLGDSVWLADGPPLPEGTPVIVRAVRGVRVVIEAA